MKSFKEYITELFSSPLPFKKVKGKGQGIIEYNFSFMNNKTGYEDTYKVMFERLYPSDVIVAAMLDFLDSDQKKPDFNKMYEVSFAYVKKYGKNDTRYYFNARDVGTSTSIPILTTVVDITKQFCAEMKPSVLGWI